MKELMTGNNAVAHGVRLARPQVIAAYPITPQTTIVERLAKFIADGELDAEYVLADGEHSMFGICIGAAAVGARPFTATSSQGVLFGLENLAYGANMRLPLVVVDVNRPFAPPWNIWCDHSDAMVPKDLGILQFFVENNQEALDMVIQAYKIAEYKDIMMPCMICADGFLVSHTFDTVEIPDQAQVDDFLPPFNPEYVTASVDQPKTLAYDKRFFALEKSKEEALQRAKQIITNINKEFKKRFGRDHGGLIEEYNCEGAEVAIVAMGSMVGTARFALHQLQREGKKIGLIKLRAFRPFPREEFRRLAKDLEVLAVVDRNNAKGSGSGALFSEITSALYNSEVRPHVAGFVIGIGGQDVVPEDFIYVTKKALKIQKTGTIGEEIEWIANGRPTILKELKIPPGMPKAPSKGEKLYYPGTAACPGCGMVLTLRQVIETLSKDNIYTFSGGCGGWPSTIITKKLLAVPYIITSLPGAGGFTTGMSLGLKKLGKTSGVVSYGGDGSMGDMGFGGLSGAAERNEDVLFVIYDNEGYMNTGIQRSGTTPTYAWTTTTEIGPMQQGNPKRKKDLPRIMEAHQIPYVATAALSHIKDLQRKLKKASAIRGCRFIQVLAPCPTGWRIPTSKTIEIAKLAVQTGIWPLYEIERGKFTLNVISEKRRPVQDYLMAQGRFNHLTTELIQEIQEQTDVMWDSLIKRYEGGR